ncbi:MAG: polysaccharide deacetylase family protein [Planctomycetes bacterium]|nr:polysaccharide deacetylase family protein [Planctomycetota bacterium]
MKTDIHICWTMDCEATQRAINDAALGMRAVRGFVSVISEAKLHATLFVLPGDAVAYPSLLRDLDPGRFELALHVHPQEEGYDDFCGAYPAEMQRRIYDQAIKKFADAVGVRPTAFRTGSCSANDATFPVTAELGFECCSHSMPGRNMTWLRSNWVSAPQHVHYAHPANRLLEGGLDLVEVPITTDPDSMLWSGSHPQDLRVELFDAKNHRYMIDKVLAREKARPQPIKAIVALTHNTFEYENPSDFRRQTLLQMIADLAELADKHHVNLVPATLSEIAAAYRAAAPAQNGPPWRAGC